MVGVRINRKEPELMSTRDPKDGDDFFFWAVLFIFLLLILA
jgi:hypothetical protein